MINNPAGWNTVLEHLYTQGFNSATLAGGAVRDYMFEKDVKDYDIFIQQDELNGRELPSLNYAWVAQPLTLLRPGDEGYNPDFQVYNCAPMQGFEVLYPVIQLIFVPGLVKDWIKTFDLTINRMWFRKRELHMSSEALRAFKGKRVYGVPQAEENRARYLVRERGYDDFRFYDLRDQRIV